MVRAKAADSLQAIQLLSFKGRSERSQFGWIVGPLVALEAGYVAWLESIAPDGLGDSPWFWPSFFALFLPMALAAPTIVRRLHDLGHSAIMIFFVGIGLRVVVTGLAFAGLPQAENPVLLVGFGAGLMYLAFARGVPGDNQYGPRRLPSH